MVNVQPFVFQHVTAFKERLQLANKINEMIAVLNNTMDPEEVLAIVRAELVNYYTKEEVDDLIAGIDLSPYYTKTEVDTIVDGIEDDIEGVEGRVTTAEGDIDNLESNKQNVLTPVSPIVIQNDTISLNGFTEVTDTDWSGLGSVVYENGHWVITFNHDTMFGIFNDVANRPIVAFTRFEKGTYVYESATSSSIYPSIAINGINDSATNISDVKSGLMCDCTMRLDQLFSDSSLTRMNINIEYKTGMSENPRTYSTGGYAVSYTELTYMVTSFLNQSISKNSATSGIPYYIKAYVRV